MFADVDEWVKTCKDCQRRVRLKYAEALHPTWRVLVWGKDWCRRCEYVKIERGQFLSVTEGRFEWVGRSERYPNCKLVQCFEPFA
jgi:hypothetical protein